MKKEIGYIAERLPDFRHPADDPPPKGVSLLMINESGVLIKGPWPADDRMACWQPLPKMSEELKERLYREGRLK